MTVAVKPSADPKAMAVVDELVRRGRAAMAIFANADQARVDEAVTALAWSLYNPAHAKELAELAVKDTQLGNVPDKIIKKQRKTFGTLRDLLRVKTVGIIEEDKKLGIVKYAKPVGVVCAITPSTNPGATPVNKAMMAIKGRNAIIIASSPAGTEDDRQDRRLHARGAQEDRTAGRSGADPAAAGVQGHDAGADAGGRSGGRHRLAGQCAARLFAAARRRSASVPAMCR